MRLEKCIHPLFVTRDQLEFQNKLQAKMKANGIDALLVLKPENILYSTGYLSCLAYTAGMIPGMVMAVVPASGNVHLIVPELEKEAAQSMTQNVEIHSTPTWAFIDDGTPESRAAKLRELDPLAAVKIALSIISDHKASSVIGIEKFVVTANLLRYLVETVGESNLVDSFPTLIECRMVKTPWEINMLRMGAKHTGKVIYEASRQVKPGMKFPEFYSLLNVLGQQLDSNHSITQACFIPGVGPYYGITGMQRGYTIKAGDTVKFDGGFSYHGYISDIARTWVVGEPSAAQEKVYNALYTAFKAGLKIVKPGLKLSDLYQEVRKTVESSDVIPSYPRGHTGHSIGVSPMLEEFPTISPAMSIELKPGMVLSLETSYFATGNAPVNGGYNIEDSFVITEDSYERFTTANDSIVWK